jgi:hypothetical protein
MQNVPAWVWSALAGLIPVIGAIVTVFLFSKIKALAAWVANLPAPAQQTAVAVIASLLNLLATKTGLPLPSTLGGLDMTTVGTLVTAGLAYVLHLAQQSSATAASVATIAAQTAATNTLIRNTPAAGIPRQTPASPTTGVFK